MSEFVWELPASRPEPSEPAAVADGAMDHQAEAVKRLIQWFKKPKNKAFIRALCKPMIALEQAMLDVIAQRDIDNASGEALNVIGRLVGQPQVDVEDVTYKALVRARIPANKSNGIGNQILLVARLVLKEYAADPDVLAAGTLQIEIRPQYPASFALRINGIDLPWELAELLAISFLAKIAATGVRTFLEFTVHEETDLALDAHDGDFMFDDSVYATAKLVKTGDPTQYILVRATALGVSGNGIVVQVATTGSAPAAWLDFDTGTNVRYRIKLSLTPTWEDLAAVINDADSIELVENTATGPITDTFQETTAGGIDSSGGEGFDDTVSPSVTAGGFRSVMSQ